MSSGEQVAPWRNTSLAICRRSLTLPRGSSYLTALSPKADSASRIDRFRRAIGSKLRADDRRTEIGEAGAIRGASSRRSSRPPMLIRIGPRARPLISGAGPSACGVRLTKNPDFGRARTYPCRSSHM